MGSRTSASTRRRLSGSGVGQANVGVGVRGLGLGLKLLLLGLAPTISTTSAVYVWHDGTQARLLQAGGLARLQGLPDNFVLPEGRVVATRLIGNAVPPALIRALLL